MLQRLFHSTLFVSLLFANFAYAEGCVEPESVGLPDGATIKSEDMIKSHENVTQYITQADVFLKCLDEEERVSLEPLTLEQKKVLISRYNLVIDKIHILARGFNEQLQIYKSTNTKE